MNQFTRRLGARVAMVLTVFAVAAVTTATSANAIPGSDPGPIADVVLQTQPYDDYDLSATSTGDVSSDFGGITEHCNNGATGSGTFHSTGYSNPYLEFDALNITNCTTRSRR